MMTVIIGSKVYEVKDDGSSKLVKDTSAALPGEATV